MPDVLLMTGATDGPWRGLAQALGDAMAARGSTAQIRPAAQVLAQAPAASDVSVLVWVESPAAVAAHALSTGGDPVPALAQWSEQTAALVRAARAHPDRWWLVHTEEARRSPEALPRRLAGWWSPCRGLTDVDWPALGSDAVAWWIAHTLVASDPRLVQEHALYAASCVVLVEGFDPAQADGQTVPDATALSAGYRAWMSERLALTAQLAAQTAACARAESSATALQVRLHDCQEQLETLHVELDAGQARERRLQAAEQELGSAQSELQQHEQLLAAARYEVQKYVQLLSAARAELQHSQGQLAAARENASHIQARLEAQRDEALAEASTCMARLHRTQEDLEQQLLKTSTLAQVQQLMRRTHGAVLSMAGLRVATPDPQGAHRHLDIEFECLSLGERTIEHLPVRLVDHRGRAGLLFWDLPDPAARLPQAWQANGSEAARDFMLFVPDDRQGVLLLERLGHQDWMTMLGIARLLRATLTENPDLHDWAGVAARLCLALENLAPRLRYDSATLASDSDTPSALRLRLTGACFGDRELGTVEARWLPAQQALQWLAPEPPDRLALQSWPADEQGRLLPQFDLRLGAAADCHAALLRMPRSDLAVLTGLLDTLAGLASQPDALTSAQQPRHGDLARLAQALRTQVRRTQASLRVRALARTIVGRRNTHS